MVWRFDTETHPIRPGLLVPKLVCLQSARDDGKTQIQLARDCKDELVSTLEGTDELVSHNGAYDYAVLANAFPDLTHLIFKALGAGRGRDTEIREKLISCKNGTLQDRHPKGWWSLAGIAKRRLNVEMDKKEESYRLRYALLDGVPISQWPEEAVRYAIDDVDVLRRLDRHQRAEFEPKDEWLQVAAAFCLQLSAVWGLNTDKWRIGWARMCLLSDDRECIAFLEQAGLLEGGTVKRAKVQQAIEDACARAGKVVPKSDPSQTYPNGQTKYDAETIDELALLATDWEKEAPAKSLVYLSRHTSNEKMMGTYLDPMDVPHAMTSSPNVIVATGRTSWKGGKLKEFNPHWTFTPKKLQEVRAGTNLQNWPKMPGIRECVRPRPGFRLCSVDYNSVELRVLGQVCLWLLGKSTFAEGYQKDPKWDPHTYFGGRLLGIDYEAAKLRRKSDPTFNGGARQTGKNSNFALPGGVGARKLHWMFEQLYKEGDLDKHYSLNECFEIRAEWYQAYPEMDEYFEHIEHLTKHGRPLTQFVSERIRGSNDPRFDYCAFANTYFQGLAADLAKRALFYVSMECYCDPESPLYGSRVVAFIHDEILAEVPIEKEHEAAMRIKELMEKAYAECCPDVPGIAEPALMTYWSKDAEFKLDSNGRLIPSC